ncbi:MAG: deoxyhypusine synthase family protein, partial [Proteobacteria bacterium]|nr:deoxyhypusine synthase family protein [Pseudomonadota bacterium]
MTRPPPIDRSRVRTVSARARASKLERRDEAAPFTPGGSLAEFLERLPDVLGAADLRTAIEAWATAVTEGHRVVFGFGAHVIKVGLAPIVVDLLRRGAIHGVVLNGAGCVHDLELAFLGHTSE